MKNGLYSFLYATGALSLIDRLSAASLTVLAYHRIADPDAETFLGYSENVSATADGFRDQLAYLAAHYQVLGLGDLLDCLKTGAPLPDRAALITFDDGYRDNYSAAFPALRDAGLPATIFLAADFIGANKPFYWDVAGECFRRTRLTQAALPIIGMRHWPTSAARAGILDEWIAAAKALPDDDRRLAVERLPETLDVELPEDLFADHALTWDQVREMSAGGIEFGSHGCSHGILARLDDRKADEELARSRRRIETETGRAVRAFAYPNGQPPDYGPRHMKMLEEHGYELAFTLSPGPAYERELSEQPFAVPRVLVGFGEPVGRFAAKLVGERRLALGVKKAIGCA